MKLTAHRGEREFALVMAAIAVIAAFWPLLDGGPLLWPWLLLALLVLLLAWRVPQLLTPLAQKWQCLGHSLGYINTRIILGLVFFLLITPLALLMRLFGRDVLGLKQKQARSYWKECERQWPPESFKDQF